MIQLSIMTAQICANGTLDALTAEKLFADTALIMSI